MLSTVQALLTILYPHQCLVCSEPVEAQGLCPSCWPTVPFALGLCCDACGVPVPGDGPSDVLCDDCIELPRPWAQGRTALLYRDGARSLVLGLKHGDRHEVVGPAAAWMAQAGAAPLEDAQVLVPVPLHWTRLFRRKYNQAALLAKAIGRSNNIPVVEEALIRTHRTPPLDGHSREARFDRLNGIIRPHPKQGCSLKGKRVVIIDDVMTSGATLAACTHAALSAGASRVCVLHLARVSRGD